MASLVCHPSAFLASSRLSLGCNRTVQGRATASCAWVGIRRCNGSFLSTADSARGCERWIDSSSRGRGRCVAIAAVADEAVAVEEASAVESLSMYFKAEGSLSDAAIPKVTKVLEGTEGVSNVKVYISEGAATVELVKQTNIQATGVASSLVEIIEQAGFKMQALSLGFDEDDEDDDEFIDYDPSTYIEEEGVDSI